MIDVINPVCINHESLQEWLETEVEKFGIDKTPYILPRTWDAKGESRFFCSINVEEHITIEELMGRVVSEHCRGNSIYFYAEDVVCAACAAGMLSGEWFWLYYTW